MPDFSKVIVNPKDRTLKPVNTLNELLVGPHLGFNLWLFYEWNVSHGVWSKI